MTKKTRLAALVAAVLTSISVSAKFDWGLKGGVNVTDFSFSKDMYSSDNRMGFYVGPTIKLSFLMGLGVDASALYDQRSVKIDDEMSVRQQQLAIPVNLRYSIGLGKLLNVFAYAGPQFGFNLNKKASKEDKFVKFKDSDVSVNVGLGVTIVKHLQLNANYNIACGKTCDVTATDVLSAVTSKTKGRFNSWQVGLAYFF